jgi:hypothetical protein
MAKDPLPYDDALIVIDDQPLAGLPDQLFSVLGRLVSWCAFIEYDLFLLYCLFEQEGQSPQTSRELFYGKARGLGGRIELVKKSLKGKLVETDEAELTALLNDLRTLAAFRNSAAHNPHFWDYTAHKLTILHVAEGDNAAGRSDIVNLDAFNQLFALIPSYHQMLTNWFRGICKSLGTEPVIYFGDPWDKQASSNQD